MIIGVSGKIGSGKDTVASIIQQLSFGIKPYDVVSNIEGGYTDVLGLANKWEVKRFADKLKDIVCLLIGCTREQLEDREFKEKSLGENWVKYRVWGANGHFDMYYSNYEEAWTRYNQFSKENAHFARVELTPRLLLQLLGTNCGRNILHPNIWVNSLFAEYIEDEGFKYNVEPLENNQFKVLSEPAPYNYGFPNWVIPDVRFKNEADEIINRGGIVIRVDRVNRDNPIVNRESETALDDYEFFKYRIVNDSSIGALVHEVGEILFHEGLIPQVERGQ